MTSPRKTSKFLKITNECLQNALIEKYEADPSVFTLAKFNEDTSISIISKTPEEIVFDMIGVEPPLANALRRIWISEIPTMAIETVIIHQNTSIIPDEVLSHRLGLIPIFAEADNFQYKKENDEFNESNSLTFTLKVKCTKNSKGEILNGDVLSKDWTFVPKGKQGEVYVGDESIRPVHDDIIINKLRPGQEWDIEWICVKGIGKTHAKWSPVSAVFYRLLNDITIAREIQGDEAKEFASLCPMKVFEVKNNKLKVGNARKCTTCRECIRHDKYKGFINLGKISDHYEFHIESVGIYEPETLFYKALKIWKEKADLWTAILWEKVDKDSQSERRMSINK